MYIYNGKVTRENPNILPFDKNLTFTSKDILLTFVSHEIKRSEILFTFSITYFNTPVDQSSYIFERLVDKRSLEKAVKETIGKQDAITIYSLKVREVVFSFNVDKWIDISTKPLNTSKSRGNNSYSIRLNKKLPELVLSEINPDISQFIIKRFLFLLEKEQRFFKSFKNSFPKDIVFMQNKRLNFINAEYDLYYNRFNIFIRNDILQMLYFNKVKERK